MIGSRTLDRILTDHAEAREDPVVEVQKGLHAEVLRYIIISLDNVMTLTVDDLADASRREWCFYLIVEHVPAVEAI